MQYDGLDHQLNGYSKSDQQLLVAEERERVCPFH